MAKKSVGSEGWQSILFVDVTTLWVSNHDHLAVAKNYSFYPGVLSGFEVEFADEGCYTISAVFKIWKTFVHKEIRQPNGAETF